MIVCRTGYTGEHGYELVVPSHDATASGTRSSRRWPARAAWPPVTRCAPRWYALHGQDLSPRDQSRPGPLGLGRRLGQGAFWGRDALLAEKAAGPRRLLWGIEALDRGIPRAHMTVLPATATPRSAR